MKFMLLLLAAISLYAETFEPTTLQFGCRSVPDYERARDAKGYGAPAVFLESGCTYLTGIALEIKTAEEEFLEICNLYNDAECYWTADTRP